MNALISRLIRQLLRGRSPTDPRVWGPLVIGAIALVGGSLSGLVDLGDDNDSARDEPGAEVGDELGEDASDDRSGFGTGSDSAGPGPNGLPIVSVDDLPPEALDTLTLIDAGGPFPFDRDGITFENREGLLPSAQMGSYSEYTVITPGERTRGARRIVTARSGELYWTDDHYASFSEIVDW